MDCMAISQIRGWMNKADRAEFRVNDSGEKK
jgi:hypothetical protein